MTKINFPKIALELFLMSTVTLFSVWTVWHAGRIGIEAANMSVIADGAWRIYIGQVPYRDFQMPIGPLVHYVQVFFFFLAGGFYWKSFIWHAATANGMAALFVFLIARRYLNLWFSALCALFAGAVFYYPVSFPWYDHISWLCVLISIFLVEMTPLRVLSEKKAASLFFLSGVFLGLSLFGKINIGIGAVIFVSLLLIFDRPRPVPAGRVPIKWYWLGLLICVTVVSLWLESNGRFIHSLVELAGSVAARNRLTSFEHINRAFSYFPDRQVLCFVLTNWLLLAVELLFLIRFDKTRKDSEIFSFGIKMTMYNLLLIFTFFSSRSEVTMSEPLLGLQAVYVLAFLKVGRTSDGPRLSAKTVLCSLLILVLILGVYDDFHRGFIDRTCSELRTTNRMKTFENGPFQGISVREEMYQQIQEVLDWSKNIPKSETILMMPFGQYFYGAMNRPSPKNIHLWFQKGLTFYEDDADTNVIEAMKPTYILIKKSGLNYELTPRIYFHVNYMPRFRQFMSTNYQVDKQLLGYTVFKLK